MPAACIDGFPGAHGSSRFKQRKKGSMKNNAKTIPAEPSNALTVPYQPTSDEVAILAKHKRRLKRTPTAPGLLIKKIIPATDTQVEQRSIAWDHPDLDTAEKLVHAAVGVGDKDFMVGLQRMLEIATARKSQIDMADLNFSLSVVRGLRPRDEVEAMLAAQMAASHIAIAYFGQLSMNANTIQLTESYERSLTRLSRTFAAQMQTLKHYRARGRQNITVRRVTVNEGGQAIVGNVRGGGRSRKENKGPTS